MKMYQFNWTYLLFSTLPLPLWRACHPFLRMLYVSIKKGQLFFILMSGVWMIIALKAIMRVKNFKTYLKSNRGCWIQVLGMFCFDANCRFACVHASTAACNTLYVHGPETNLVVLPILYPCVHTNISNSYDALMKSKCFF